MVKKTRRNGGMVRSALKPLGRAVSTITTEYAKDWAQKKLPKVVEGVYKNPDLASQPEFVLTGKKPVDFGRLYTYNNENANPNKSGGRKRRKTKKRGKNRK